MSISTHAAELGNYKAVDLLKPCEEGDNDARWGSDEEARCEQFINGFTGAYLLLTNGGKDDGVCLPPPGNRSDEIRWAFTKWVYEDFSRRELTAAEALVLTVRERFKCK